MARSRILAITGIWIVLMTCSLVCSFGTGEGFSLFLKEKGLASLWPPSQGRVSGVSQRAPVFSFEGQIVYSGTDHNLWLLNGTTGERMRITNDGSPEGKQYLNPAWSPDGRKLVFVCKQKDQPSDIFLIRAWTGKMEKIGQGWEIGAYPWSEDSSKIVYSNTWSNDTTQPKGIWTYDLALNENKLLLANDDTARLYLPEWAPKGGMISFHDFCSECAGRLSTISYNLPEVRYDWGMAGTDRKPGGNFAWSADGEWLVFDEWKHQGDPGTSGAIWKGTPDGQRIDQVYKEDQKIAVQPQMSPNGHAITFGSMALQGAGDTAWAELMLIDEHGNNATRLYSGRSAIWPLGWSKNSKQILFIDEGPADDSQPRWRPTDALLIFDLQSMQPFQVAEVGLVEGYAGAAWSTAADVNFFPRPAKLTAGKPTPLDRPFHYDRQTVIYLKPNGKLALHNLAHDDNIELPTAEKVKQFFLSPHQKYVFYQAESGLARLLVLGEIQQNVIATVNDIPLSSEPGTPEGLPFAKTRLHKAEDVFLTAFSTEETPFAYVDRFGHTWLVRKNGTEEHLPYAYGTPAWSSDGRWMSFITLDGHLYVSEKGGPFKLVTDKVENGSMQWSPDGTMLAYTQRMRDHSRAGDPRKGKIYIPSQSKEINVMEMGGVWGWSQDGKLLALDNLDTADPDGKMFSFFLYNPWNNTHRELIKENPQSIAGSGRLGWSLEAPPYIFNRFQILNLSLSDTDSNGLRPIIDNLLAVSADGRTFFGTSITDDKFSEHGAINVDFHCWNEPDGEPNATIGNWSHDPLPVGPVQRGKSAPMQGYLSSDGKWAAVVYQHDGLQKVRLAMCNGLSPIDVAAEDRPVLSGQGPFSPNGYWWGSNVKENEQWNLHLRSLNEGSVGARVSIPTAERSVFYWFGDGK